MCTAQIVQMQLTRIAPSLAPVIHYAPAENLEHVDVALIDGARHEIDLAA
jgi:hypothetical protein